MQAFKRYKVLKAMIHAVRPAVVLDQVFEMIASRKKGSIHVCTVHTMLESVDDPRLAEVVNQGTMAVPDGMPLVWLGRRAFPDMNVQRCYGPDLMLAICEAGVASGVKHFFYGGTPEVLQKLQDNLESRYPGINIVESIAPPFRELTPVEKGAVAEKINAAEPDIVWVGLGTPKQDLWMGQMRQKLDASVLIAVGAAFDFHAGMIAQAPLWMQRSGLEWFYRLCKEPRRLWKRYIIGNPRFIWLLLKQWCRDT